MPTFGVFHRQISATGGDDFKRPLKEGGLICALSHLLRPKELPS